MKINHKPFLKFMLLRHSIYLARQAGKRAPWTKDPVLQTCFFTNVYRELDKVTIWVDENIRQPYARDSDLPFYLCVARHFNLPSTLKALLIAGAIGGTKGWDGAKGKRLLKAMRHAGDTIYTGAYLVSTAGLSMDKLDYSFDKVLDPMYRLSAKDGHAWAKGPTLESAHAGLSDFYGWAGFMAYEVVCDLRYTSWLSKAPDKRTWANPGPGAKRGINRLLGNGGTTRGLPTFEYIARMQELLAAVEKEWPHKPALELREIEHSLCEFDKYERVRLGDGRSKRMYNATGRGK